MPLIGLMDLGNLIGRIYLRYAKYAAPAWQNFHVVVYPPLGFTGAE
jgi:hypothetical protein